jgi:hypothetical protein
LNYVGRKKEIPRKSLIFLGWLNDRQNLTLNETQNNYYVQKGFSYQAEKKKSLEKVRKIFFGLAQPPTKI